MIFGIVVFPNALVETGKMQEFFDKFKAGLRTHNNDFAKNGTMCAGISTFRILTLPAPQKNFVNIFFVFAWEFCVEKWRGWAHFFLVSVSHEAKHEKSSKNSGKIRSKIGCKIRDENSKNLGNFRSATFLAERIPGDFLTYMYSY